MGLNVEIANGAPVLQEVSEVLDGGGTMAIECEACKLRKIKAQDTEKEEKRIPNGPHAVSHQRTS